MNLSRFALRAAARAARGRRMPKRLPIWQHPDPAIWAYLTKLNRWITAVQRIVRETVIPRIPAIRTAAAANIGHDDWGDEYAALIFRFEQEVKNIPFDETAVAAQTARQVADFNGSQWARILRSAYGVDIFTAEPWLKPMAKAFVTENVSLITSMQEDAVKRVGTWVNQTVRQGGRAEDIARALAKEFRITRNKAKLIANDQVNKLNADITQSRQTALGVTEYIWSTSHDERVRPLHRARDGKVFKWSQPPEDGHPGQPIRCRCKAIPVLKNLLDLQEGDE